MVKELNNKSFTDVYQDYIIQIYSNADITRFSDNIDNSTQIFKELNLFYYSNDIRHILSRIVLKPNEELTKDIYAPPKMLLEAKSSKFDVLYY